MHAAAMHRAGKYQSMVQSQQQPSAEGGDSLSVNKAEYERLLKDHAAQEHLIDGFQRENERLAKLVKEHETEQNLRTALYYDQREELNKELNRLRNAGRAAGGVGPHNAHDELPVSLHQKSAEALREELRMDAEIRTLKERLAEAEAGMGVREREMQHTIEKLRRDNRELAATAANVNLQQLQHYGAHHHDEDFLQLQTENSVMKEELGQLRQKVAWYVQNQQLLDATDEEKAQLQAACTAMRQELQNKGMSAAALDRITAMPRARHGERGGDDHNTSSALDRSLASTATSNAQASARGGKRSFADIKRIKYEFYLLTVSSTQGVCRILKLMRFLFLWVCAFTRTKKVPFGLLLSTGLTIL